MLDSLTTAMIWLGSRVRASNMDADSAYECLSRDEIEASASFVDQTNQDAQQPRWTRLERFFNPNHLCQHHPGECHLVQSHSSGWMFLWHLFRLKSSQLMLWTLTVIVVGLNSYWATMTMLRQSNHILSCVFITILVAVNVPECYRFETWDI